MLCTHGTVHHKETSAKPYKRNIHVNTNTNTNTTVISIAPTTVLTDGALQKSANTCFTAVDRLK